jgi:luciferase family oxidoreductase group 1
VSNGLILDNGSTVPLSVLDLVPIRQGGTAAEAMRNTLELAQHAERWGYRRYWMAEHHNIAGIASSATAVLIGYVAGGTKTIRVGSGGIMLPNHAPLIVAEQFGTLETLYSGRIDLGLGRAPGTDMRTARALRRDLHANGDDFPALVAELRSYLADASAAQPVRAVPGVGTNVPIWILGSSTYGAQLAGSLGLPFSFAAHFQPNYLESALQAYRTSFRPSEVLAEPYAMVCIPVIAADTDDRARYLASTPFQSFLNLIRNRPGPLPPPVDDVERLADPMEQLALDAKLREMIVGGPERVRQGLEWLLQRTQANEIMVVSTAFEQRDRLRSYEIVSEVGKPLAVSR